MKETLIGMTVGAVLAAFACAWGFLAMIFAALFMGIGAVLGRATTGKLDLRGVINALIGKNDTSSD